MMLADMPPGTRAFIDANILAYHFIDVDPLTPICSRFLERVEQCEIEGYTSTVMIAEATHKVMLAEAIQQFGLPHKGLAHKLQKSTGIIGGLSRHKLVVKAATDMKISVKSIGLDTLREASDISTQYELLTNDSITIAVMRSLALDNIATNDENFHRVAGLRVWEPK